MNYHNIKHCDMNNGDGLRVTLFVSGCEHHCPKCHNPQTWDVNSGIEFDDAARKEVFRELVQPYCAGITFSGGDPLHPANIETVTSLAREIKHMFTDKTVWCYTGYTYEEVKDLPIMKYIDVLVDGEFKYELLSPELPWVGSSNQRVIRLTK